MMRLFELVKKELGLPVKQGHLTVESVESAKAVYMVGTTLDVVRVQKFNQRTYTSCAEDLLFYELLKKDQL